MDTTSTNNHPGHGIGFIKTSFNGLNALTGIGILSVPYALSQGGWLSPAIFIAIVLIIWYTGILLQRCIDSSSRIRNYPDIGEVAFGWKGKIVAATLMYLELYLCAIDFLIMEGDNLGKLFPAASFHIAGRLKFRGKQGFVVIASLVVLPTTWLRSLDKLAYVSLGDVLASVVLIGAVVWVGAFGGVGFHERGVLMNWAGVPTAMSLCYCTLNLPPSDVGFKIAIYATLVNPLTKYALYVAPIADAIEDSLRVAGSSWLVSVAIRTALVVGTTFVALAVPQFGYVTMLIGALLSTSVTMLLPCVCYLKISFKTSRKLGLQWVVCVGIIILVAVGIAVAGTWSSLKHIVENR